jgi:uncharacterized membrane protein (UPF0127 family)
MKSRCRLAALTAAILLGLASGPVFSLQPSHLVTGFPRGQAVLETAGPRCLLLDVYFASTAEQRAQGLMFVEALSEFEGMYFSYDSPVELTMWMKNTVLPLDMLFIREDSAVGHIARDTQPFSTDRISSGGPVVGVLELNAGFARRWRVEPGTRLLLL